MTDTPNPGPGELLARCHHLAARAASDREQLYRCPACQDLGWVEILGTTYGGRKQSRIEQPCTGPTGAGCAYRAWRDEHRSQARPVERRGRMD